MNSIKNIAKDIVKSGVSSGIKTVAEKNYITSWIKRWYEEYGAYSGERRSETVEECFNNRLNKLEQEIGKEQILKTKNLASLFTSTCQSAMNDIDEDKVKLYANAFINAIKNESIEDTKKHIFLNMLRDFSLLHIEVLIFFSTTHNSQYSLDIPNDRKSFSEDIKKLVRYADEDEITLFRDNNLFLFIIDNFYRSKLIIKDKPSEMTPTFIGLRMEKQTTSLGDDFLQFISDCEEVDE